MTASTSAQTTQTVAKAPVQIGKPKEEAGTNGFANLLADSITKSNTGVKAAKVVANPLLDIPKDTKKASVQHLGEVAKGKTAQSLDELDLSLLGELEPNSKEGKPSTIKLGDLLAELSHESSAPIGSEVINLKTVLSSKNDDPDLINKDLISLVAKKDRKKVTTSLIEGAKQLLTEQLEARIPKNRVPKTLKGLLETAIRFNLVVSDIKLESLPESKATKELLQALDVKEKTQRMLPSPLAKVAVDEMAKVEVNDNKVVAKKSPLEQILNPKEMVQKTEPLEKEQVQAKEQVLTKALESGHVPVKTAVPVATTTHKDKERQKTDAKETVKVANKELLAGEALKMAPATTTNTTQMNQKGSSLEKLLAVDTQESSAQESKTIQESSSTQTVNSKQDTPLAKAEGNMSAKMAEARQLVSQLSADVKEAMESYKPPFTKLSMKLNPERLGDIDVVMIQRGNNVHINLSSNGLALGLLQQNSADLKAALNNAGLGDATMNFSSNGENRNPQEQQQQHSTSEHYAEMSKLLDDIDNLEIVVPRYV